MTAQAALPDMTIAELAPLLQRRELSPVDLTVAVLERAQDLNPFLNSYITLDADGAMAAAAEAEKEIAAGRYRGPLHGIPIAHKDVLATRDLPTTAHSRVLGDWRPDRDATVVARLRDSGAVSLGKANTYEFACGATPVYGLPINPWSAQHITGGSSAGSASAVSAGLCIAATGTDTAGSIRVPSSFCGIVGFKPSYGLIGRGGLLPVSWSLDFIGPMTRSVMDAAIMLDAMAGHDPDDPASSRARSPGFVDALGGIDAGPSTDLRGMRLGIPADFHDAPVQPQVVARLRDAYATLESLGAELVEVALDEARLTSAALRGVMWAEATIAHLPWLRDRPEAYAPDTRRTVTIGTALGSSDYLRAQRLRQRVRRGLARAMDGVDALVWPAAMRTAFGVAEPQGWSGQQTRLSNLTGTPSITVPCGLGDDGLPIGLQVNGRPFEDATVLRVAAAFEASTDFHRQRPTVRRVAPPPPTVQFARTPAPEGLSQKEFAALEADLREGHRRHGVRLLDEDVEPLMNDLHAFRHDLDLLDEAADRTQEPAVHQRPWGV